MILPDEVIAEHVRMLLERLGPNASPAALLDAGYKLAVAHNNLPREAPLGSFPYALPTTFREQTAVAEAPRDEQGNIEEGVAHIPYASFQHGVVTCWKFSPAMAAELARTRRLYISILSFSIPAMQLSVSSPFLEMDDTEGG